MLQIWIILMMQVISLQTDECILIWTTTCQRKNNQCKVTLMMFITWENFDTKFPFQDIRISKICKLHLVDFLLLIIIERDYYLQGEYPTCPPPIALIFGYVLENWKIRYTYVFFYSRPFSYLGGETTTQSYKIFRCSSSVALVSG